MSFDIKRLLALVAQDPARLPRLLDKALDLAKAHQDLLDPVVLDLAEQGLDVALANHGLVADLLAVLRKHAAGG